MAFFASISWAVPVQVRRKQPREREPRGARNPSRSARRRVREGLHRMQVGWSTSPCSSHRDSRTRPALLLLPHFTGQLLGFPSGPKATTTRNAPWPHKPGTICSSASAPSCPKGQERLLQCQPHTNVSGPGDSEARNYNEQSPSFCPTG